MASAEAKAVLKSLVPLHGNRNCFECDMHHPQWVSVNNGIFICLECSGRHRSVGVHLSFVRSVTMDSWKEKELALMKAGGNDLCKQFLESHGGDYKIGMPIEQKYKTRAAHLWRDKLNAMVEGRDWCEETSPAQSVPLFTPPTPTSVQSKGSTGNLSGYSSFKSSPSSSRYEGFGNRNYQPPKQSTNSDPWESLSTWGQYLTDTTTQLASTAGSTLTEVSKKVNENVITPTSQKVNDGTLLSSLSTSFWASTQQVQNSTWAQSIAEHATTIGTQATGAVTSLVETTRKTAFNTGSDAGWADWRNEDLSTDPGPHYMNPRLNNNQSSISLNGATRGQRTKGAAHGLNNSNKAYSVNSLPAVAKQDKWEDKWESDEECELSAVSSDKKINTDSDWSNAEWDNDGWNSHKDAKLK